ncbi:MAG: GntR family transcriptional regulator [Bryobacteraceae bacterium]|jgi:GntR family transcriptional regulator
MSDQAQIRLDVASSVPAWRQIVSQLRTLVVEGVLKPGDALPPVRRLALDLGIHFNTVAEAYRTLAQEGFLEIVHGHGARVVNRPAIARAGPDVADDFHTKVRELVAGARARGLSVRKVVAQLRDLADAVENL